MFCWTNVLDKIVTSFTSTAAALPESCDEMIRWTAWQHMYISPELIFTLPLYSWTSLLLGINFNKQNVFNIRYSLGIYYDDFMPSLITLQIFVFFSLYVHIGLLLYLLNWMCICNISSRLVLHVLFICCFFLFVPFHNFCQNYYYHTSVIMM